MIGVYGAGTDWDRLKGQVIKFYHKWPLGRFPFLNSYFYDGYNIWTNFRLNLAVKNEGSFAFQNFLKNIVFILLIFGAQKNSRSFLPEFRTSHSRSKIYCSSLKTINRCPKISATQNVEKWKVHHFLWSDPRKDFSSTQAGQAGLD